MYRIALASILLLVSVPAASAAPRKPFRAGPTRLTELKVDRWHTPLVVERSRTPGHDHASFSAESAAVEPGSALLFTIRSVSKKGAIERWSCVAFDDVSECLEDPVRLLYLPGDEKMVLEVSAHTLEEPFVRVAAALRSRATLAGKD